MVRVTGLREIQRNLAREVQAIKGRSRKGMVKAGLFVKGEAQEITPQDKGVLINSSFVDSDINMGDPRVRVGYTAKYAPAVHEMPADTNWTKPGTGNKFLEKAVKNNFQTILRIIRNAAKIQ